MKIALEKKQALVTGAKTGIGLAIAQQLAVVLKGAFRQCYILVSE